MNLTGENNFLCLIIRVKVKADRLMKFQMLIFLKPLCRLNSENLQSVATQNNEVSSAKCLGFNVKFLVGQQCKLRIAVN